jgi:hypothetical protein
MNDIEDRLHAMLTRDADAVAGQTDSPAEWRELTDRLDAADRRSTRVRWGGLAAVAAVAAAAVVVAAVSIGRPTADVPPAGPSATPSEWSDSAEILGRPALDVPAWAAGITPLQAPRRFVRWAQSDCTTACVAGTDKKLALLFPYTAWDDARGVTTDLLDVPSYQATIDSLRSRNVLQVSPWSTLPTANAGTAQVVVLQPYADQPAVLGCEQLGDSVGGCRGLSANTRNVVAVIDAGHAPLVVWLSARGDTDAAAQDAEMAQVLSSLRFTGLPVSCTGQIGPQQDSGCLEDLRIRIQQDSELHAAGATVTVADYMAAVKTILETLGADAFPAFSYSLDEPSPLPDGYEKTTEPLVATWTIAGTRTTTYACFLEGTVVVATKDCR